MEEDSRNQWSHLPETRTVADGFVWGRGALDVKCGVIGIMAAIELLAKDGFVPERTIYLAFGHDEEVGGQDGNAAIAKRFANQQVRLGFVLDEGGAILDGIVPGSPQPVALVAIAEKRPVHLTITAHGEGGHGSMPGRSAVVNLAEAIVRLERNPMPARLTQATEALFDYLGPEMPLLQRTILGNRWLFRHLIAWQFSRRPSTNAVVRSTINFTQLQTNSESNQNATIATATVNARLLPGDSIDRVIDHISSVTRELRLSDGKPAIECKVERTPQGEGIAPVDCPEFFTLQHTIHQVFPDVIVAPGLTSVSTDSSWYYAVTDKIYRFIPMRVNSEDVVRIHGLNERIAVDNLGEIVQFYAQLLRNSSN